MSRAFTPDDVLAATQGIRSRSIDLLRAAGEEQAGRTVPTCPAWTAKELACHVYGVCDDLVNGRLEGIGSEAWTQAQVDRHAATSLDALLDEWAASGPAIDAFVVHIPKPANLQLVMDMATHEHDLRYALGAPGAQDDLAVSIGAEYLLVGLRRSDPELAGQIEGLGLSDFELLRSLSGRRSPAQLAAAGVPVEGLAAFLATSPMTMVTADIDEHADRTGTPGA